MSDETYEIQRIPSAAAERHRQKLIAQRVLSPNMTWADHLFADVVPDEISGTLERVLGEIEAAVHRATKSPHAHQAVTDAIGAARERLGIPAEVSAAAEPPPEDEVPEFAPPRRSSRTTPVGTGSAGPDNPKTET